MRVNFARFEQAQQSLGAVPLYPLAKWTTKDDEDATFRSVKLDLKTNPTDSNSPKFSSYFKVFENGSSEQWCRWREDLSTVYTGLNLTTGKEQLGMTRHLLGGQARDTFNEYFSTGNKSETNAHVAEALKVVAATIFPDSAVVNQKQYMRHELKKPNKLTARETATRLLQLNTWLAYYPADGEDPTAAVTKLDETEIREIYYRLLPMAWRRKMDENVNFDRTKDGLRGLIDYAERLETSEARFDGRSIDKSSSKNKSQSGSNKPDGNAKKGKSETGGAAHRGNGALPTWTRDCLVHGDGCGHPSHKCKILIDHAGKVKGQFKASYKENTKSFHKKSSTNAKPWQKDNKERTFTKREVQMLLKKTSERLREQEESDDEDLDKELNQISKLSLDGALDEDQTMVDALLEEFDVE
jgi:hypothetical protein